MTVMVGEARVLATDSITCRDPLKWPFSAGSIWNTPIGSEAVYVHAGIERAMSRGLTVDEDDIVMIPEAQMMYIYRNNAAWDRTKSRCPVEGPLLFSAPIPHDFIVSPDTWDGLTPNSGLAVLMPDRRTIRQTQPFAHCDEGEIGTSRYAGFPDQDIYGPGHYGAHGGSGLSAIGGALRVEDLTPDSGPIRHALKVNLYGKKNYYYDQATGGFRWPATRADGYASNNYGTLRTAPVVKECRMGALLAIPPWINLDSLGFETEPARILAETFRDYGAYIVDDAAWDVYALITEWSPEGRFVDEFHKNWGFSFKESSKNTPWGRDMDRIFLNLHVVDNNGPNSIGGGGELRMPAAPDFYPTGELTIQADGTPGGTVGPAGTFQASIGLETRIAAYTDPQACSFSGWTRLEGSTFILDSTSATTAVIPDGSDARFQANFRPKSYSLTTQVSGSGTIEQDTVSDTYVYGTEVSLTALAEEGWEFTGWSGDFTGTVNPLRINISKETVVTAHFETLNYTLIAGHSPGGSVAIDPQWGSYPWGSEVTLTAEPDAGWNFINWTGDLTSEENPLSLTMDRNWIVYASFDSLDTFIPFAVQPEGDRPVDRVQMITDLTGGSVLFLFPRTNSTGTIEVYDISGSLIMERPIHGGTIEIVTGELSPGIYFARVVRTGVMPDLFKFIRE